jgi:hypothetical protein
MATIKRDTKQAELLDLRVDAARYRRYSRANRIIAAQEKRLKLKCRDKINQAGTEILEAGDRIDAALQRWLIDHDHTALKGRLFSIVMDLESFGTNLSTWEPRI